MRYIILFMLFSKVGFSQNYYYAVDKKSNNTTTTVSNQLEEIAYFNAHLLEENEDLQTALDTYGSVRLDEGDYSGTDIVMNSNQSLYGYPTLNLVGNITIAAGSSNVHLEQLLTKDKVITFQSGGLISNCTLRSIKWGTIKATNATLEDNSFIDIGSVINFDCSESGYFRNNKIIKHQAGTVYPLLTLKGNSTTPSYGNVHFHTNLLTPHGDATDIDNIASLTFIGIDAEGWNLMGEGENALIYAQNMGDFKITSFEGSNDYSAIQTPVFDIQADNLFILDQTISGGDTTSSLSLKTNIFSLHGLSQAYYRDSGSVLGFDIKAHLYYENDITYNDEVQSPTISDADMKSDFKEAILGTEYTPWARPVWETLPNPLGENWEANRVGQTDQTSYIQGLIDAEGIADLPEGIFYISSTLSLPVDREHGIVGKGTGKTVIVGLTDDFPLISLVGGQDDTFVLAYLTLQGGSVGVYASQDTESEHMSFEKMKYVVFRNQNYGIQLHQIKGFDNNFLDNLGFVNCNIGFFQDPLLPYTDSDTSSFVDKTVFYKNQFINCTTAVSMEATRADNLNAWIDCKFDGNGMCFKTANQNSAMVANSDFTNNYGEYLIEGSSMALYSCDFYNNTPSVSMIASISSYIEGCNFLDDAPLFTWVQYNDSENYIVNSYITGDVEIYRPDGYYGETHGVYVNSHLEANPTLSKMLVNVKDDVSTVLIDEEPTPYPQLLVTH